MDAAVSLVLAFAIGLGQTFQAAALAALTRSRGGREASLTAQLATGVVLAGLLAWIAMREGQTRLLAPLDSSVVFLAGLPLMAACLWLVIRGLPVWYAAGGLVSLTLVLSPRLIGDLGLAVFFSATTLGGCTAALAFDHTGALGSAKRAVTAPRVGGLLLVGIGVVLVRVA